MCILTLLHHYKKPWAQIFLSESTIHAELLRYKITKIATQYHNGFRDITAYLNTSYGFSLLESAPGLFFEGPGDLAREIEKEFQSASVKFSHLDQKRNPNARTKVLMMGKNYVIANDFQITKV